MIKPELRTKELHVLMKNIPYVCIFAKVKVMQQ